MNINHLKYFVDAVDLNSCSEAARKNRISQPALSQSIRSLELELGYEILHHRPKSFEVTDNGTSFLAYARQILELVEKAKSQVVKERRELRPVRIICTHSFFKFYLKSFLPGLKQRNPDWSISVLFGDRDQIKQSLIGNLADIGFLLSPEKLANFETREIQKGHFYEISLGASKLNQDLPIYVTSLKDKEIKRSLKAKKEQNVVEIGSWESIYDLVDSQLGRGVVPDYLIKNNNMTKKRLGEYNMLMLEKKTKKRPCAEFSSVLFNDLRNGLSKMVP